MSNFVAGQILTAAELNNAFAAKADETEVSTFNHLQTGHFYVEAGARLDRLADRVFAGGAVDAAGTNVANQGDWLTSYEISKGHANGSLQDAQHAFLQGPTTDASNCFVAAAQTKNLYDNYFALGIVAKGISNRPTGSGKAYAAYFEAFRDAAAAGGAYGLEIDTMNYVASVNISPYSQSLAETVALQLAAGGEYPSSGQFSSSAAINIQKNGSNFLTGIVFGSDAIAGTDGTTGTATAIAMGKGHIVGWFAPGNIQTSGITSSGTTAAGSALQVFDEQLVNWLNNQGRPVFSITYQATDVNYLQAQSAGAGGSAKLVALGTDANIDLQIVPKGTGSIWLGGWTSNADAAVNGYVTVKDSAGTVRKLATIA